MNLCPHCLLWVEKPGYCKVCSDFLGRLTLSPPAPAGGSTVRANDAAASCGRDIAVPPAPILTGGR